ncbi:MAG: ABC transporter ATP-binding protein [Cellvibrionaceae bacterium]
MNKVKDIAVQVKNLSKCYKLYVQPKDMLLELITRKPRHENQWALKDVSFDIPKGEVVGILGQNGAGKSTLLKILAGTLDASSGSVDLSGKLSAILELGTGFHPDYTGRENIVMGGMCLGMSRLEVMSKMDEIIAFSELEEVIDHPFKTYSSGMQGRLTFSTAMCIQPDIFIVDEALATGDALFQEKCMTRLKEICSSGSTVLLVTHSLSHIYEVCTSCMLFDKGRLLSFGDTYTVGKQYEKLLFDKKTAQLALKNENTKLVEELSNRDDQLSQNQQIMVGGSFVDDNTQVIDDGNGFQLLGVEVVDKHGHLATTLLQTEEYTVCTTVRIKSAKASINLGFKIQSTTGLVVIGDSTFENDVKMSVQKNQVVKALFKFRCALTPGTYLLGGGATEIVDDDFIPSVHVKGNKTLIVEGRHLNGLLDPNSKITIERMDG